MAFFFILIFFSWIDHLMDEKGQWSDGGGAKGKGEGFIATSWSGRRFHEATTNVVIQWSRRIEWEKCPTINNFRSPTRCVHPLKICTKLFFFERTTSHPFMVQKSALNAILSARPIAELYKMTHRWWSTVKGAVVVVVVETRWTRIVRRGGRGVNAGSHMRRAGWGGGWEVEVGGVIGSHSVAPYRLTHLWAPINMWFIVDQNITLKVGGGGGGDIKQ